ncbi:MAG: hypothetical protein M1825_000356 [Sarcosagium campestre]|nr:MAG: hypothetical protein M1825_000356 [Sarcosagium campestre]
MFGFDILKENSRIFEIAKHVFEFSAPFRFIENHLWRLVKLQSYYVRASGLELSLGGRSQLLNVTNWTLNFYCYLMTMNPTRWSTCLRCRLSASGSLPLVRRRPFHSTTAFSARRKPGTKSVKAGKIESVEQAAKLNLPSYSPEERKALEKRYSPDQLRAIEAAEEAIDPKDIISQGTIRSDPMALRYLDDFSEMIPVLDKPQPPSEDDLEEALKSGQDDFEDLSEDFQRKFEDLKIIDSSSSDPEEKKRIVEMWAEKAKDNERAAKAAEDMEFEDYIVSPTKKMLDEDAQSQEMPREPSENPFSDVAPAIPRFKDPKIRYAEDETDDDDPMAKRLLQQTGFDAATVRRLRTKILVENFVTNQTHMGKIHSTYFLCVAGNGNGLLGIGEGKSTEPEDARRMAVRTAIRNMQPVQRYERRTIYGEVQGKVGAAVVKISSRPPGFGIRCQHIIFEMARCAGIDDLAARVLRSRNPMNVAKATFEALRSQRLPEDVARARGRKMVDVRKVYYSGMV